MKRANLTSINMTIGLAFMLLAYLSYAQPCLAGWDYRVPITINNSGNASTLTNYQVRIELDAQSLVVNDKANVDGSDFRFLDASGTVLSHWVDDDAFGSATTVFWVKIGTISASSVQTIYMYYGNDSATGIASGDGTFELFDDFDGVTLDAAKWSACGTGGFSISDGSLILSSSATANQQAVLESVNLINSDVYVETDVETLSNGQSFIGLKNTLDNGFAMNYEVNGLPTILMREINTDGAGCYTLTDVQDPVNQNAQSANTTTGTWSFGWYGSDTQSYSWPGQATTEVRNEDEHTTPAQYRAMIGHKNQGTLNGATTTGSFRTDWLRVRKYTSVEPTATIGTETEINAAVEVSGTSAICNGDDIMLYASSTPTATFSWTGPNGFSSSQQNPVIGSASTLATGTYTVTSSVPNNCGSEVSTASVTVYSTTVPGSLSGATTVCSGSNSGTITLSGHTGDVIRWERSESGEAPWVTIDNTTTTLTYNDLVVNAYYRAVVKNGECDEEATDPALVQVDDVTVPGAVNDDREVCFGTNTGVLRLTDFTGPINRWQYQEEGSSTWTDIASTDTTYTYTNLTVTTYFRAEVQSGVCAAAFSEAAEVKVHPLPVPDFTSTTVCNGFDTELTNTSTITEGTIELYEWDFTDGSSATGTDPIHSFDTHGTFNVELTATSGEGCIATVTNAVVVNPLPVVDFLADDVCQRETMEFLPNVSIATGSVTTYDWDFGDGTSSNQTSASLIEYLYDTTDTYQVGLVATSNLGCQDSLIKDVFVHPRAVLDYDADFVFEGQESEFENNSAISDGNLTYQWSFGDGNTSTDFNPTHFYASADTFNVRLISLSTLGACRDTLFQEYVVHPQVVALFDVENVCRDDTARFVNNSMIQNGDLTYEWDFGDGNTSTEEAPIHNYEAPGSYLVTLRATSDLGSSDETQSNLIIYPEPNAEMDFDNLCEEQDAELKSLGTVSSGSLTYDWDFGDGNLSTDQDPIHQYATDGTYDVLHVVTTNYGCRDSVNRLITVHPLPQTQFSIDTACFDFGSEFINETVIDDGSIASYLWNFGDQTNSIEVNPTKLYNAIGNYDVTLSATSDRGCVQTFTDEAVVLANPEISFTSDDVCFGEESEFINGSTSIDGQMTFSWDLGNGTSSVLTDPTVTYSEPGTYTIKLVGSSEYGCSDSTFLDTEVFILPTIDAGEDQTASRGYAVELLASGGDDYFWTPAEGLSNQGIANPLATPAATTEYRVFVTDENGCEGEDFVTVTVLNDFILEPANLVTPDGNGINDTWNVGNIENYENSVVKIFDLWGRKIYESEGYDGGWDGTGLNGSDVVPEGEYFFLIASPDHSKVYKGTLSILRGR